MFVNNHSFGIINFYTPNDVERSLLWWWIADSLPPTNWVLCDNFNIVEDIFDKEGLIHFRWIIGEREAWFYLHNKLVIFYPNTDCRHRQGIWHTY